jgi:AAA+ superfamily predicted ATPase
MKTICEDIIREYQIEILPVKKLILPNRNYSLATIGNHYGLRVYHVGNTYVITVKICINGTKRKRLEYYHQLVQNLSKTYTVHIKPDHLNVCSYLSENDYKIIFYDKNQGIINPRDMDHSDFKYIGISTNKRSNLKITRHNLFMLRFDIKHILRLIELLINTISQVYTTNFNTEMDTCYKAFSPSSTDYNHYFNDEYAILRRHKDFFDKRGLEQYRKSSRTKRILRIPERFDKEKKYQDKSLWFNCEMVKDGFVTEVPKITFDDIGGCKEAKQELKDVIHGLKNPRILEENGVELPTGIILYGPPGTGKTMLAKAVAYTADINFFKLDNPLIYSKWIGESEMRLDRFFTLVKANTPCIVCIDEADSIFPSRDGNIHERTYRILSMILEQVDGFKKTKNAIFIAITNIINNIDFAFFRGGRFGTLIEVPLPNLENREDIWKIHCRGKKIGEIDYGYLAKKTNGLSGADIKEIIQSALRIKLREAHGKTYGWGKKIIPKHASTEDFLISINRYKQSMKLIRRIEDTYSSFSYC